MVATPARKYVKMCQQVTLLGSQKNVTAKELLWKNTQRSQLKGQGPLETFPDYFATFKS